MTLYLCDWVGKRGTGDRVLGLCPESSTGRKVDAVARWNYDGTDMSRRRVLEFIEQWAREVGIEIGNPEFLIL